MKLEGATEVIFGQYIEPMRMRVEREREDEIMQRIHWVY